MALQVSSSGSRRLLVVALVVSALCNRCIPFIRPSSCLKIHTIFFDWPMSIFYCKEMLIGRWPRERLPDGWVTEQHQVDAQGAVRVRLGGGRQGLLGRSCRSRGRGSSRSQAATSHAQLSPKICLRKASTAPAFPLLHTHVHPRTQSHHNNPTPTVTCLFKDKISSGEVGGRRGGRWEMGPDVSRTSDV